MKLLSTAAANTKTAKSQDNRPDYTIVTLSLSPDKTAPGLPTNCPNSSPSCVDACVGNVNVGMAAVFKAIMEARIRKTVFLREDRAAFLRQLTGELEHERDKAYQNGTQLAVRLNCFSDLPWEMASFGGIPQAFPDVDFWDYSKCFARIGNTPDNYSLTASWTERPRDQEACAELLHSGTANVAIVFGEHAGKTGRHAYSQRIPRTWNVAGRDFLTYDGDTNDMRHLDWQPRKAPNAKFGRICGLRLKAGNNAMRERALASGFAVKVD
jgi:hypothetical protein